jgi:putative ABC transport system ATP-binding protein
MNISTLEFQNVWKSFGDDKTKIDALNGINLQIEKNSLNLILGPSGSGKSTLLNLTSLLDVPTDGKILFNGQNTSNLSKSERSSIRRKKIGIIYQRDNLFPYLNILENIMVSMGNQDREKALNMLKNVDLSDINKFPDEISIFKQQKAALARAVINNPSILLADEPTGELNSKNTEKIMKLITDVGSKCTVLIASNNPDLSKYCDNIFSIKDGIIKK